MKYFQCLIFLFFFGIQSTNAQFLDSIADSFHQKKKFLFKFDTRNSFIINRRAEVFGVKAGVAFGLRFKTGVGYHYLNSKVTRFVSLSNESPDMVEVFLKMRYVSVFAEYIFHKTQKWEFVIPVQVGVGKSWLQYFEDGKKIKLFEGSVIVYEPSISGQYKFFPWLGVGADYGYRVMLKPNRATEIRLTSPVYGFRVVVFYGELFKTIFPEVQLPKLF